jgi:hypothetical protein
MIQWKPTFAQALQSGQRLLAVPLLDTNVYVVLLGSDFFSLS